MTSSVWHQQHLTLPAFPRGFHLITPLIVSQLDVLGDIEAGLLHLFLQHTSASLTINENADATVRADMEAFFNHTVKENEPYFRHTYEGPDDMPAHIKSSLLGCQLSLPIQSGALQLGTWQGIYLGEHRNNAGARRLVATINGYQVTR